MLKRLLLSIKEKLELKQQNRVLKIFNQIEQDLQECDVRLLHDIDIKTRLINSLNKIQAKVKEIEHEIKQSEINSKNCIRKQSRSKEKHS